MSFRHLSSNLQNASKCTELPILLHGPLHGGFLLEGVENLSEVEMELEGNRLAALCRATVGYALAAKALLHSLRARLTADSPDLLAIIKQEGKV